MMKVEVSDQVLAFVRRQAPHGRRRLRQALRRLAQEHGDIQALEGSLRAYWRLRVGPYRIVFAYARTRGQPISIRCLFVERRDVVYEIFSEMLKRRLVEA